MVVHHNVDVQLAAGDDFTEKIGVVIGNRLIGKALDSCFIQFQDGALELRRDDAEVLPKCSDVPFLMSSCLVVSREY